MRRTNEICPICGKKNVGLDLIETEGLYECEQCGWVIFVQGGTKRNRMSHVSLLKDINSLAM